MIACPYCGAEASRTPCNGGSCGSFPCLYRRFCCPLPATGSRGIEPLAPPIDPNREHSIALLRPGQLGDLLLAIPALRALRRAFPDAEITLIGQPWTLGLPERLPYLDRVHTLPGPLDRLEPSEANGGLAAFPTDAVGGRYDLVLQLHADAPSSARFALELGGGFTAGFCRDEETARRLHLSLPMLPYEPEPLRPLRLLHSLGVEPGGVQIEFPPLPGDLEEQEWVAGGL